MKKIAVVTGAGGGIGKASALRIAKEGAIVMVVDRDEKAINTVAEITDQGGEAYFSELDVTKANQVESLFKKIQHDFGTVDWLHCNAGIQRYGSVVDTTEETWDEVMAVNVKAAYLCCHYAIPLMQAHKNGSIVLTASVQAFASQTGVAAYSASKGAIVSLTKSMALDHAQDHIRVNAIAPASVDTPMLRNAADLFTPGHVDETIEQWGKMHPVGRVAKAEEIAEVVLFLLSDRASFITGSTIVVDGGLLAQIGVSLPHKE